MLADANDAADRQRGDTATHARVSSRHASHRAERGSSSTARVRGGRGGRGVGRALHARRRRAGGRSGARRRRRAVCGRDQRRRDRCGRERPLARGNGRAEPELDGCFDVDLEASACTNTLPIHRLAGLGIGEEAAAPAVYVRATDLAVMTPGADVSAAGVARPTAALPLPVFDVRLRVRARARRARPAGGLPGDRHQDRLIRRQVAVARAGRCNPLRCHQLRPQPGR